MTRQAQIDAQLRRAIEALGIMAQKNVDRIRQNQWLDASKVAFRRKGRAFVAALKVDTDQVKAFALRSNRSRRLTQNPNPCGSEQLCDRVLRSGINLMIAEAAENAEGRTQRCERLHHFALRPRVPSQEVACQRDQIWL